MRDVDLTCGDFLAGPERFALHLAHAIPGQPSRDQLAEGGVADVTERKGVDLAVV